MGSPQSATVVRTTLPAVGGALGEITARFYDTVFADVEQPEQRSAAPYWLPKRRRAQCRS